MAIPLCVYYFVIVPRFLNILSFFLFVFSFWKREKKGVRERKKKYILIQRTLKSYSQLLVTLFFSEMDSFAKMVDNLFSFYQLSSQFLFTGENLVNMEHMEF